MGGNGVPDGLLPVEYARPKCLIATADCGQYGIGRSEEDEEEDELFLPSIVEKARICRELNWQLLPWEMDDLDVAEIKTPLTLLRVYDIFQKYGKDIESITASEAGVVASVEHLREILDQED